MSFPQVPEDLKRACPDLKQVNPNDHELSKLLEIVTNNYATYHECRARVDAWNEWYNTQRSIYESVK